MKSTEKKPLPSISPPRVDSWSGRAASRTGKGKGTMEKRDGGTTWRFGDCTISYERNITFLVLSEFQDGESPRKAGSRSGVPGKSRAKGRGAKRAG